MRETRTSSSLLFVAALSSFVIALFHIGILLAGPPGYRYFGAPSLAVQVERGSWVPPMMCIAVAAILTVWGLYALSGAGRIRPLPLLRTVIAFIGAIYFLRGLLGIPQAIWILQGRNVAPFRYLFFSLVSGVTGVLYLAGLLALLGRRAISAEPHAV